MSFEISTRTVFGW